MSLLDIENRRRKRLYLPLIVIVSALTALRLGFFGTRRATTHALMGFYSGFPGRNGDHMYYTSMALQFAGKSLPPSLQAATHAFKDFPGSANSLYYGFLDPSIATLIYPRQVLTQILSWGYRAFGVTGFGVSTALIGLVTLGLLIRWSWREWGVAAAWFTAIFALGSTMMVWYGTGIFIEAPLLLLEVVLLYSLPISRNFVAHKYWHYVNALVIILMAFTRQSPLLPMAILFGGWFATYLRSKVIRNAWFGATLSGSLVALSAYYVTTIWAPYSPTGLKQSRHFSLIKFALYLWHFLLTDPVICLALVLAIYSIKRSSDRTLHWIAAGVFISCLINIYVATTEYRYWAPLLVLLIPLASFQVLSKLGVTAKPKVAPIKPYLALYLSIIFSLTILVSALFFYGRGDGSLRSQSPVTAFYPSSTVTGSLACYGPDLRIYWLQSGKKLAALNGTAMAANPGMANQLHGPAHQFTIDPMQSFIAQCVAVSGS